MIADRLRWNATNRTLNLDTLLMQLRDQLIGRAGY